MIGHEFQRGKIKKCLSEQVWDQADQFLVLRSSEKSEAICHSTCDLLRLLLGAAARLETSSENPTA